MLSTYYTNKHKLTPTMLKALRAMCEADGLFQPVTASDAGVTEATMAALRSRGLVKLAYSNFTTSKHGRSTGYRLTMAGAGVGVSERRAERATN